MTRRIRGILFDLDGVLVFTDQYHYRAWKAISDRLGIAFDETTNDQLRGVSRMQSLEIILRGWTGKPFSDEEKRKLAEEKNAMYRELLLQMTLESVSGEVRQTLKDLRKRGYRLAVGSSSKNAGTILERTQLAELFDAVSDGNNISRSKPDPEVFVKAAGLLGLPCETCAVVEDANAGIDAALEAGMLAIGIGAAAGYEKADYAISGLGQLTQLFMPIE